MLHILEESEEFASVVEQAEANNWSLTRIKEYASQVEQRQDAKAAKQERVLANQADTNYTIASRQEAKNERKEKAELKAQAAMATQVTEAVKIAIAALTAQGVIQPATSEATNKNNTFVRKVGKIVGFTQDLVRAHAQILSAYLRIFLQMVM